LPLSPTALANDAYECRQAGAAAVHIHPRGMGGRETLEPDACAAAIEAIRDQCPGLPIGLTTGLWIVGNSAPRQALIEGWTVLRDALARSYDVRIGLEDTLTLRDNSRAAKNADLVASVAELAISSKSAV